MEYTEKDIKEGMKLRCVNTRGYHWWTVGKIYEVKSDNEGALYIASDDNERSHITGILMRLNNKNVCNAHLEIVEEEKEVKYTKNDIKEGMKLRCVDDGEFSFWTTGKVYVVCKNKQGDLYLSTDSKTTRDINDILHYLNNPINNYDVSLEIVKDEYTKFDIKEGMVLECTNTGGFTHWTKGKKYIVTRYFTGELVIKSDTDSIRKSDEIALYLNGIGMAQFKLVDKKEEEKEVRKEYVEVTELLYGDVEKGVSIGDVFEVSSTDSDGDVRVFLNDDYTNYLLTKVQFKYISEVDYFTKLSNKDKYIKVTQLLYDDHLQGIKVGDIYRVTKVFDNENVNISLSDSSQYLMARRQFEYVPKPDIKEPVEQCEPEKTTREKIEDKIKELRAASADLYEKAERVENQGFQLEQKANRLEKTLETLKEFE